MAYTLDTQIGTLLDNPQAKAIIDQYAPGVSTHPMIGMARSFSLRMILSFPQAAQAGLTQEKAEQLLAEINKAVG